MTPPQSQSALVEGRGHGSPIGLEQFDHPTGRSHVQTKDDMHQTRLRDCRVDRFFRPPGTRPSVGFSRVGSFRRYALTLPSDIVQTVVSPAFPFHYTRTVA
jgi:hypothetical protein